MQGNLNYSIQAPIEPMLPIQIRPLELGELDLVFQIDRSEEVSNLYRFIDGELVGFGMEVSIEQSDDFWSSLLPFWKEEIERGAVALGAFSDNQFAGFAILKPDLAPGTSQLLALYVSAEYRLSGVAKSLYLDMEDESRKAGAKTMYLSATPSKSAVSFYLSQGYKAVNPPEFQLSSEKPGDIVMVKELK